MSKHFSLGVGFQTMLKSLPIVLFTLLMFPATADAVDKSGWMTIASEIVGDDVSCGAGKVKHELVIRNLETGDLATPPAAFFQIYDASDNLVDNKSGFGVSTVGPVCFHPDNDAMVITVPDSSAYYSFSGGYLWLTPDGVPRGKFMRTTVWLRPKSNPGFDYRHTDPSLAIFNVSPTYKVVLNDFPSTYGATGVQKIFLYVTDWNTGVATVKKYITGAPVSGGVGTKTLPAQTLPDGLYTWGYYIALNGNKDLGGFEVEHVLMGQRSGYNFPFMLDTTAPDFSAGVSHTPPNPSVADSVTITANANDALAGITQIVVYLDGAPVKTCSYFYAASASCVAPTGPFPAGSTHSYYAVATDGAGNVATSLTQNFTVGITGICGSADGASAPSEPVASPALPPNNICQSGTPSIITQSGTSFNWTCDGSDGISASADDASCSAPKSVLKLCLNACDSGSSNFNGGTITLNPSETRNLRACFNVSSACDTNSGDVTGDAATTFDATDAPADAVALTAIKGQVQVHATASGISEVVNVLYGAIPASVTFSVPNICSTDCSAAADTCRGTTFDDANGCGTNNCTGTRYCDFNWKEVAPGN